MKYFKYILYLVVATSVYAHADDRSDFFRAVEVDNADRVESLLKQGFDPNTRDDKGQVPLYLALRSPSPRVAAVLLRAPKLEVDATNNAAETPLMMAALKGERDWAERLLAKGAQVNRGGWTPLHYAATGPDERTLALLLDRGAEIEARSPSGMTPLMMAARYGTEAGVDLLLKRGADPRARNPLGQDAADFAATSGRDFLVDKLRKAAGR